MLRYSLTPPLLQFLMKNNALDVAAFRLHSLHYFFPKNKYCELSRNERPRLHTNPGDRPFLRICCWHKQLPASAIMVELVSLLLRPTNNFGWVLICQPMAIPATASLPSHHCSSSGLQQPSLPLVLPHSTYSVLLWVNRTILPKDKSDFVFLPKIPQCPPR